MAGPEAYRVLTLVDRLEIGKADDVVIVAVGEEKVELVDAFGDQRVTGLAQPRPRIEEQNILAASNLDAGCISPIGEVLFAGYRQTSSYAPEPHSKVVVTHSVSASLRTLGSS
ncbi:hypothetical protein D9M70_609880 [compost metagenome]